MDYSEGKKKAVSEGTAEHNRIDSLIKTIIIGFGGVVVAIAVTIWAWNYSSRHSGTENPPQVAGSNGGTQVEQANTSSGCPGELETVTLTASEAVVINPGGQCIVQWRVDKGRVDLIDISGNSINVGPEGGSFDTFWTESVSASTSSGASMHYKLVTG